MLIADLPLNSVTRPRKEELDEKKLQIPVEKIALQVLKKFYEADLSKVIEIATPLFALYYEKPCMLDAHACTVENGNVCFRVPSERTIDTIMENTASQDTQWEEFHNKSTSDFEWRNKKSGGQIEKAIGYLEQQDEGIHRYLNPKVRVVQAYSYDSDRRDEDSWREDGGRDYSFMFS